MATQNLTRAFKREQKKSIRAFASELDFTDEIGTSADVYELFNLPAESLITSATVYIITPNDAGTSAAVDVGFDGGDTLIDGGNLQAAADTVLTGGTNSVIPIRKPTGGLVTFLPTYVGTASTEGKCLVYIEYIEYNKREEGELTNFSATA